MKMNKDGFRFYFKKLLLFGIALWVVLSICSIVNRIVIDAQPYILDSNIKTVFLGDSHIKGGVIFKMIPNSINVGQAFEPLAISFLKARHIVDNNPQIDKLVVGFSYNNLSTINNYFFNDPRWRGEMFKRSYPIIAYDELKSIKPDWQSLIVNYSKNIIVPNIQYIANLFRTNKVYPFIEKKLSFDIDESKVDSLIRTSYAINDLPNLKLNKARKKLDKITDVHFNYKSSEGLSLSSLEFMRKLVAYTKRKQIDLYLVSMPMHRDYLAKVPKKVKQKYTNTVKRITKNQHVHHIDLSKKVDIDLLYRNHDHLNALGAVRATEMIAKALELPLATFQ